MASEDPAPPECKIKRAYIDSGGVLHIVPEDSGSCEALSRPPFVVVEKSEYERKMERLNREIARVEAEIKRSEEFRRELEKIRRLENELLGVETTVRESNEKPEVFDAYDDEEESEEEFDEEDFSDLEDEDEDF